MGRITADDSLQINNFTLRAHVDDFRLANHFLNALSFMDMAAEQYVRLENLNCFSNTLTSRKNV